ILNIKVKMANIKIYVFSSGGLRTAMPWKDKSKYRTEAYREYMRSYQRSWHQRNKAKRNAKVYERKEQLWEFYNQLKATLECAHCGENHPATLQFHHRDPQNK